MSDAAATRAASRAAGAPRRGIVLGAGGTLGAAWMIARLRALELERGFDARDAELLVGSSAGSVLAAMIASGVAVQELLEHQHGEASAENPLSVAGWDHDSSAGGSTPQRPPLRLGSPALLGRFVRHPRRLGPLTGLAAVLPPGKGTLDGLRVAVGTAAGGRTAAADWPARLRVVAMDYRTGDRVTFGEPGAPPADLVDAVVASCSIPGWFSPATIDGRRYVDAGFRQATSADVAAGRGLDEVVVLAALASYVTEPRDGSRLAKVERRWRGYLTRVLEREVAPLADEPVEVTVITPSAAERRAMGGNLMDHRRRTRVLEAAMLASGAAGAAGSPAAGGSSSARPAPTEG